MTDILLLGPYGSGKTTQAMRLARAWGYVHFNAGQSLRNFVESGTPEAAAVKAEMAKGELVPPHMTVDFFREAAHTGRGERFVIDGTPRAMDQVRLFERAMQDLGRSFLPILISLSDDVSLHRQVDRRTCARCHLATTLAEKACPSCGGAEFITRPDNDPAIAQRRIDIYHAETDPVIEHYRAMGLEVVDGEQPVEGVTQEIVAAVTRHRLRGYEDA